MEDTDGQVTVFKENVDCNKYTSMALLKELRFHGCHIENLSALSQMPSLKVLGFTMCTFGNGILPALEGAPALARIDMCDMGASGPEELHGVNNLKRLYLLIIQGCMAVMLSA